MPDFQPGDVAYVAVDQCKAKVLEKEPAAKRRPKGRTWKRAALLWGDEVMVRSLHGSKLRVSAKGHLLEVKRSELTDRGILSLWQIDCGQGDAALIRFPDGSFAAVDVGPPRSGLINSNSARTAVDFFKWIAFQDHNWRFEGEAAGEPFHFEWIAFSHPDEDHIGAGKELVSKLGSYWSIGTVYHCGLGRYSGREPKPWRPPSGNGARRRGFSQLGLVDGASEDRLFLTSLIDGWGDVETYSKTAASRPWKLAGNYASILKTLHQHRGGAVQDLRRLSHHSDGSALGRGGVRVEVLGPIEETLPGTTTRALRYLDNNDTSGFYNLAGPSLSRNGHSLVLRLDYGDVRILLTGDLNFKAQALLQAQWPASELACHVAKACHHGSQDVSWKFLEAMSPLATMFSSGDQETHVHPRALILGLTGRLAPRMRKRQGNSFVKNEFDGFEEPELFAPLLYSTELSRSARLRADLKTYSKSKDADDQDVYTEVQGVHFKGARANDTYLRSRDVWIVDQMTYGLINVRTDGERILLAVLEEGDPTEPEYHLETLVPAELVKLA